MALQAFLSHSSKDKDFIEKVAKKLGQDKVVYDVWDFEAAEKILDEIHFGIGSSVLFVLFISDSALNREWVLKELDIAKTLIDSGKIKKFLPIVIDTKVAYSDQRIPDWVRIEYNLKYVGKVSKCSSIINQHLIALSWELNPKNSQLDQLFIGRNKEIQEFEERLYNFNLPRPSCFIIAGIPNIGRKKFFHFALYKSNLIKSYYRLLTVSMNSRDSIEDLIIKVYGLGFSSKDESVLKNLSIVSFDKKILLLAELLDEIRHMSEHLLIIDNKNIVSRDGQISNWFLDVIKLLNENNKCFIGLISQIRLRYDNLRATPKIFQITIPELGVFERRALFQNLLDILAIEISSAQQKAISDLFLGFPEQISHTVQLIADHGANYVLENSFLVIDFSSQKVSGLINSFENDQLSLQVLKILSEAEFVSLQLLDKIFGEEQLKIKDIIEKFSSELILSSIGFSGEYYRLNDSVRDYIQRLNLRLEEKYSTNLRNHIREFVKNFNPSIDDVSDFFFTLKEGLKQGAELPQEYLIPSHYINAIRELYNYERRYRDVVTLAEKVLENHRTVDKLVIKEIRYWMCLALARLRDSRFFQEVRELGEIEREFVYGFYYRLIGKYENAVQCLIRVLEMKPDHYRAKSELVQSYLNSQQYEKAYSLARENYLIDKNNPYNLYSFIRCLISIKDTTNKDEIIRLIYELGKSSQPKAKEMYLNSLALYTSMVEGHSQKAFNQVDEAIKTFPRSIYPYLMKLDIIYKYKEYSLMEETVFLVEKTFDKDSDIFIHLPYIKCKCFCLAKDQNYDAVLRIVNKDIQSNYSNEVYENIKVELNSLAKHRIFFN